MGWIKLQSHCYWLCAFLQIFSVKYCQWNFLKLNLFIANIYFRMNGKMGSGVCLLKTLLVSVFIWNSRMLHNVLVIHSTDFYCILFYDFYDDICKQAYQSLTQKCICVPNFFTCCTIAEATEPLKRHLSAKWMFEKQINQPIQNDNICPRWHSLGESDSQHESRCSSEM